MGVFFLNASWKKSQNQLIRFGTNLWKRRCMRLRKRIWHGAENLLSNCKSWQEGREMLLTISWEHWGKEGECDTLGVENYFSRGLESRFHAVWKCCCTTSSLHLQWNIFSEDWDSCVAWPLQVLVCAVLYLSYKGSMWTILHSLWGWKS